MILVYIFEISTVLVLVWFLVTQVAIPVASGRPIFPMFRRLPKLEEELARAREERDVAELERKIAQEKSTTTGEKSDATTKSGPVV